MRIRPLMMFASVRAAAAAAFLIAVVATGALVRSRIVSGQSRGPHNGLPPAAVEVKQPVQPLGLSRKRKGFDDAIAVLEAAAPHNQRLAAYYDRVTKRTKGQSNQPEAAASARGPLSNGESEVPTGHAAEAPVAAASPHPDPGEPARAQRPGCLVAGDVRFDPNPAIDRWVSYYTGTRVGRSTMQQGLERCEAYLDTSRAEFKQSGLPQDLVWLAQVESVWKQGAYSRVAAGGIWQFMPTTAADYGLVVGNPADERFDPAKETSAAAAYLRDLYTLFGDWELALAAYNCGEPRLMGAIVQDGKPNFWDLYDKQLLPKETCNYVPKILAAIEVASDPERYGFTIDAVNAVQTEAPAP